MGLPDRPPETERERQLFSLEEGEMLVNMGPQHPSTHGVMRLLVKVRSEVVTDLDVVLGYLHRGIEKLCENATYTTVLTYVDPMDYMSAMHNEHAPALAFEKLYGIQAPMRAQYIRALVVELNRVFSHGLMMGFLALDMGGLTPDPVRLHQPRRDRRHAQRRSAASGCSSTSSASAASTSTSTMSSSRGWATGAPARWPTVEDNERILTQNEIFTARTKGMGVLTREGRDQPGS